MAAAAAAARPEISGGIQVGQDRVPGQTVPESERSRVGRHRLDELHFTRALQGSQGFWLPDASDARQERPVELPSRSMAAATMTLPAAGPSQVG